MVTLEFVCDYVLQHFPKVKITKNGTHFTARCVFCGDSQKSQSKRRFNLDWNNERPIWHCFNCSESGSFLDLYSRLEGISRKHAYQILYQHDVSSYSSENIKEKLNGKGPHGEPIPKEPQIFMNILDDCLSPTDSANGYITQKFQNYLLNFIKLRKIPNNIKLFVAHKGKYKGRIIIPVYNNENDLIYFQGRAVNESIQPKYLNPDTDKQLVIYNDGNFERDKYIIVSEGLLDAFMVPKQGTTCLGSSISEFFIKMLMKKTDKGVILAFDNDKPGKESMLNFMRSNKYSNVVSYFLFPDKYSVDTDLNALVAEYEIDDVYQLVIDNSFSRVSTETKLRLRRKLL